MTDEKIKEVIDYLIKFGKYDLANKLEHFLVEQKQLGSQLQWSSSQQK